ncbi:hypothetical protein [Streptomyces sp. FIT100]|uniref:hypothetical protein n=1 Tax=Streptomyces sp. FIT100 TaxID=2837956 RepID=UPI0021C5E4DB|nr:hypothetical protein [Streptomyces sp. FIT100]UUN28715.1 hypothetical protein KK483_21760 [Streptomyces sp. FIT100]
MPDRRRRTALRLPLASERGSLLLRDRQSTEPTPPSDPRESRELRENPFAPPPEGAPDRPWQPRHGAGGDGPGRDGSGRDGSGRDGSVRDSDTEGRQGEGERPAWGSQWSSRQPGRSSGGFGGRSGGQGGGGGQGSGGQGGGGQGGPESGGGPGTGLRWDPTDPVQRRARYALLAGMWAFFFAVFDLTEIALLLGALALYWGGSALRAKARPSAGGTGTGAGTGAPAATPPAQPVGGKPQVTAAVSGLVMATLALAIVAMTFTLQIVYRDFYTCREDALTKTGQLACNELLPDPLRKLIGVQE